MNGCFYLYIQEGKWSVPNNYQESLSFFLAIANYTLHRLFCTIQSSAQWAKKLQKIEDQMHSVEKLRKMSFSQLYLVNFFEFHEQFLDWIFLAQCAECFVCINSVSFLHTKAVLWTINFCKKRAQLILHASTNVPLTWSKCVMIIEISLRALLLCLNLSEL